MRPTRHDGLLAAALVALCLLVGGVFLFLRACAEPSDLVAVVRIDGSEIARLPLSEDSLYETVTGHTVEVKNGTASVTAAPCPDQVCVRHHPVRYLGECIICLPEALTVTVEEVSP